MLKKSTFPVLMVVLILFPGACYPEGAGQPNYVPGEVLVKFRADVSQTAAQSIHERVGSKVVKHLEGVNVDLVKIPEGWTVEKAIKVYQADPGVEYAEPNYIRRIQ